MGSNVKKTPGGAAAPAETESANAAPPGSSDAADKAANGTETANGSDAASGTKTEPVRELTEEELLRTPLYQLLPANVLETYLKEKRLSEIFPGIEQKPLGEVFTILEDADNASRLATMCEARLDSTHDARHRQVQTGAIIMPGSDKRVVLRHVTGYEPAGECGIHLHFVGHFAGVPKPIFWEPTKYKEDGKTQLTMKERVALRDEAIEGLDHLFAAHA
jgi:hypothetical protein